MAGFPKPVVPTSKPKSGGRMLKTPKDVRIPFGSKK